MDDQRPAQGHPSRRAGLRGLPTPTDVDGYVDDAPPLLQVIHGLGEPRIAELDALLREVDDLRTTMRRDLALAATATSAGAEDMAGWLLLGEGGEVRAFEQRALAHLQAMEDRAAEHVPAARTASPARRGSWLSPAAPLVATAAAVIGLLTGIVPSAGLGGTSSPQTSNSALQTYDQLTQLASDGASLSSISAAARRFHAAVAPLVAAAGSNPAAAEKAMALLQGERAVIASEGDSSAFQDVLAQADALVRRLQAALPRHRLAGVPDAPVTHSQPRQRTDPSGAGSSSTQPAPRPAATTAPSPAPSRSSSPTPVPSPAASPTASPRPSSSPSGRPSPSPSPSDYPIPRAPGLQPV